MLVFGKPADALIGVIIKPDAQARGVARTLREGRPSRPAADKPSGIESFLGFVGQGFLIFSAQRRARPGDLVVTARYACWRPTSRRGIFSLIGLFNGAPDLAKRSEEILREEFAKR